MAGSEAPLLRRSSDRQSTDEDESLLTGEHTHKAEQRNWSFYRTIGLATWASLATAAVIILSVLVHNQRASTKPPSLASKRNLVMMVSDGMGPTSLSLTRSYKQYAHGTGWGDKLALDPHLIGQSRTRSTSSLVTDSAAGATAFSCGFKSYNGAIAVLPDHTACGTVLEAAKKAGYMTGLVVTTRITDATPACFASHVNMRSEEDRIAEQLAGYYPLGRVVDLIIGGGRCHFLPNATEGSCRDDGKDVIAMAREKGFNYVGDRAGFDALKQGKDVQLPLLALLADTDIPYEIDRRNEDDVYPSLKEMALTALNALSAATKDSKKGFFLMVEGSRIDHAGHANDPAAQVHEVLSYDDTFAAVVDFVKKDKTQGVVVGTSDHETGGLAVARQLHPTYPEYLWYPGVLTNVSHSAERLGQEYFAHLSSSASSPKSDLTKWVQNLVTTELGIHDASDEEIRLLVEQPDNAPYAFADMVSRRAQTGWSTHGHSAADVNIYASNAADVPALVGNHENTEVGEFLHRYLDVDVEAITRELSAAGPEWETVDAQGVKVGWLGRLPNDGERLDGQDHVDHYKGDYKKHKRCEICGL
ncbi:alkaline phosphatase [Trichodelitschia bisporula]|uniref:Alkaline phosphatase n=1 Tax=Trichodelitschia bisporula TaxID=703511 RepID=A0A6G1I8M5_9PEZI|nr:alkaline phosphatase [Trichodelitschia bisporula]